MFSKPISWSMPSNSGYDSIQFETTDYLAEQKAFVFDIGFLRDQVSYNQQIPLSSFSENTHASSVILRSIQISEEACGILLQYLEQWLNTQEEFTQSIELLWKNSLVFQVACRDGFLTKKDHPMFTFYYSSGSFRLELFYVIDHSCVQIAKEQLEALLSSIV